MQSTIFGFEETMQFQIVNKTVTDHDVVESGKTPVILWFEGSIQPMPQRELLVKPEGERKWKWWMLYTDLDLEVDAVIKDRDGTIFRVMTTANWSQSGFQQYQIVEGPMP